MAPTKKEVKKPVLQDKNPMSVVVDGVQINAKKFGSMDQTQSLKRLSELAKINGKGSEWPANALKAAKEAIAPKEAVAPKS